MKMYIGLDVHSKKTVYVAQDETGKVISEGTIPTSVDGFQKMIENLHPPKGTQIGLETGTQCMIVSRILSSMYMNPIIVNAKEVRDKARRLGQKSDRRDAFEICDGIRRGIYTAIVYTPGPEILKLRQILSRRRHFVKILTKQANAVKFLLRSVMLSHEAAKLTTWHAWEKLLSNPGVADLKEMITLHAEMWKLAHKNVLFLEEKLKAALENHQEAMDLLTSLPGIGLITAATYLAVIGTPKRFCDSNRIVSYIGLAPSTYDSGERERHGHITKQGSSELRSLLCEVAHHAANARHPLNPYFTRVCARSGYKKAVVCVAHRMARILYQMWRKGERFDVKKLNVVQEEITKKRKVYYRIKNANDTVVTMQTGN